MATSTRTSATIASGAPINTNMAERETGSFHNVRQGPRSPTGRKSPRGLRA
jgi:hypothetical protein